MKPFNLKDIIKERANKEANFLWATKSEQTPLPTYTKQKVAKGKVFWEVFFRGLNSLKP